MPVGWSGLALRGWLWGSVSVALTSSDFLTTVICNEPDTVYSFGALVIISLPTCGRRTQVPNMAIICQSSITIRGGVGISAGGIVSEWCA